MVAKERWETINEAARIIRDATGHDDFTLNDLRYHIGSDQCDVKVRLGKAYVKMSYVEGLIYSLGKMNY